MQANVQGLGDDEVALPALAQLSVMNSTLLKQGQPKEVDRWDEDGVYIPPWADNAAKLATAFLGRLVADDIVRQALLSCSELYPFPVEDGIDLLSSHSLSWEQWELLSVGCSLT